MEVVIGICEDKLFYEQNEEGKYDIMIVHKGNKYSDYKEKKYRTGFIFDSIKLFNAHHLRVSQTDSEGNTKYGLITVNRDEEICLPCCFDKIKPYQDNVLQAFIGKDEFYINKWGQVYTSQVWKITHRLVMGLHEK